MKRITTQRSKHFNRGSGRICNSGLLGLLLCLLWEYIEIYRNDCELGLENEEGDRIGLHRLLVRFSEMRSLISVG